MKYLVTSGCSFTQYHYDTWADHLGKSYENFYNLGLAGTGPRYTYIRLMDFIRYVVPKKNIDYEDLTVIAQWSSLLRFDFLKKDSFWNAGGQIDNNIGIDKNFIDKYFTVVDRAADLVGYIEHLKLLSDTLGFKFKMTYMFEPWKGDFLGEPSGFLTSFENESIKFINSNYHSTLKDLYKEDKYWIKPSIQDFALDNPDTHYDPCDNHPTPYQHLLYSRLVNKILKHDI